MNPLLLLLGLGFLFGQPAATSSVTPAVGGGAPPPPPPPPATRNLTPFPGMSGVVANLAVGGVLNLFAPIGSTNFAANLVGSATAAGAALTSALTLSPQAVPQVAVDTVGVQFIASSAGFSTIYATWTDAQGKAQQALIDVEVALSV